jgi:hypothetical protein
MLGSYLGPLASSCLEFRLSLAGSPFSPLSSSVRKLCPYSLQGAGCRLQVCSIGWLRPYAQPYRGQRGVDSDISTENLDR